VVPPGCSARAATSFVKSGRRAWNMVGLC
jgi:hypothetical protein